MSSQVERLWKILQRTDSDSHWEIAPTTKDDMQVALLLDSATSAKRFHQCTPHNRILLEWASGKSDGELLALISRARSRAA